MHDGSEGSPRVHFRVHDLRQLNSEFPEYSTDRSNDEKLKFLKLMLKGCEFLNDRFLCEWSGLGLDLWSPPLRAREYAGNIFGPLVLFYFIFGR